MLYGYRLQNKMNNPLINAKFIFRMATNKVVSKNRITSNIIVESLKNIK